MKQRGKDGTLTLKKMEEIYNKVVTSQIDGIEEMDLSDELPLIIVLRLAELADHPLVITRGEKTFTITVSETKHETKK